MTCSVCKKEFARDDLIVYRNGFTKGKRYTYYACRPCKRFTVHKLHPGRQRARTFVYRAVKDGKIEKPKTCSRCNTAPPEAHHPDYNKPLEIIWLCRSHHTKLHRTMIK